MSIDANEELPDAYKGSISSSVVLYNGSKAEVPAAQQTMVDLEAEKWASLWHEGKEYHADIPQEECAFSTELLADALTAAARSFPADTGVGMDNIAPRALTRLSAEAIQALAHLLRQLEKLGHWTDALDLVLIVLIPKADGGLRPIGLLPTVIRVWSRARAILARTWRQQSPVPVRKCWYGSSKSCMA